MYINVTVIYELIVKKEIYQLFIKWCGTKNHSPGTDKLCTMRTYIHPKQLTYLEIIWDVRRHIPKWSILSTQSKQISYESTAIKPLNVHQEEQKQQSFKHINYAPFCFWTVKAHVIMYYCIVVIYAANYVI